MPFYPFTVFIARLVVAPVLLAFFLVVVTMLTLMAGVLWVVTGRACVYATWPTVRAVGQRRYNR